MDVAFLLDKYFKGTKNVSIDVFDARTLNDVYKDVVNKMTSHLEIEVSVLQALSYCLYECLEQELRLILTRLSTIGRTLRDNLMRHLWNQVK
jgi:hypothetical protein